MYLQETFEVHDTLNPKLWDIKTELLLPDVREKLIEIVEEFKRNVWIPLHVLDVHLVGSNASFNYTDYSDLDVHLITRFDDYDASEEIVNAYYNAEKTNFNKSYDISIHGVPVELYVEDVETTSISNGIYSLYMDKWIKHPTPIAVKEFDIEHQLNKWIDRIEAAIAHSDVEEMGKIVDELYCIRKNSISAEGEYSQGNQLFKEIRNLGYLDQLKDLQKKEKAKTLTLEKLGEMMENYTPTELLDKLGWEQC